MKNVVQKFIYFINIDYAANELDKMYERLGTHSKNESAIFKGDSFKEETLQIDFMKLDFLYKKMNDNFIKV